MKKKKLSFIVLFVIILFVACNRTDDDFYYSSSQSISESSALVSEISEESKIAEISSAPAQSVPSTPAVVKPAEPEKPISTKITNFNIESAAAPAANNDIVFEYNGEALEKEAIGELYYYAGRLYLEPEKFVELFNTKFQQNSAVSYNFTDNTYNINGISNKFSQPVQKINDKNFISLFDIAESLNLFFEVSRSQNKIIFYEKPELPKSNKVEGHKQALIRLEDVAADCNKEEDYFTKFRIMGDYLKSKGVVFSVAFIPKYVNPQENVANDPSKDFSMLNIDFVYTLDSLIKSGGKIGLHGYTHQKGNEVSGVGNEFGMDVSLEKAAALFESALGVTKRLNVECSFFEFPHYYGTKDQYKLAERYFDILYNPPKEVKKTKNSYREKSGDRDILYLVTPIDYLSGDTDNEVKTFCSRISKNPNDTLGSMFFHPYIEIKYINITEENNKINVDYNLNSPLSRILNCFADNDYVFIAPNEVK